MVPDSLAGITTIAAGFFFSLWLVTLWAGARKKPKEKRWYSTDIPSTLHIEHEA
jgi:hypothetical protein